MLGLISQTFPGEGLERLFSWVECHPLKNTKMFVQPLPSPPPTRPLKINKVAIG